MNNHLIYHKPCIYIKNVKAQYALILANWFVLSVC